MPGYSAFVVFFSCMPITFENVHISVIATMLMPVKFQMTFTHILYLLATYFSFTSMIT